MTGSERHERVSEIFLRACELPADRRAAWLGEQCGDDAHLLAEVEEMLACDGDGEDDSVLDPGWAERLSGVAAEVLGGNGDLPDRPHRIGSYEIVDVLGEGGMGTVYRARQQDPDREVALKVVRSGFASPALHKRFRFEAQVLGRLQHPGIAQIYEAGTAGVGAGALPYFAMELVEGRPLLDRATELDTPAKLELLARICDAVHYAHRQGVIHRDLKPGNILVVGEQPKILDFGVARATDSDVRLTTLESDVRQLVGTVTYMSPEQLAGDAGELDARSDVYALGVVLYELLAGRRPYDVGRLSIAQAARAVTEEEPTRLSSVRSDLRGDVETIVEKALEKEQDRRYDSAAELAADLRRYLADEPITARPATTLYQLEKFARRNRAVVLGVAAVFVVLVAGVVTASLFAVGQSRAREDAERAATKAEAVREFFLRVLSTPAPDQEGRHVTVVEALQLAQAQVELAFPDQPEIRGDVHEELAVTLKKLGEDEEARYHARQAVEIRTATLGAGHLDTIASTTTLAATLLGSAMAPDDVDEAEKLLDGVLERLQEHPMAHERRIDALLHRANVYWRRGRLDEAERLTRECIELCWLHLPESDPRTTTQIHNLTMLLRERGGDAVEAFREVVELRLRYQGPNDPATFDAQRALADSLSYAGRPEEAEEIYRAALPAVRERMGAYHPVTIDFTYQLAYCLGRQSRKEESAEVYAETLALARTGLPADSRMIIVTLDSLALTLGDLDRLEEAAELHAECLAALQRTHGAEAPGSLRTAWKLSDELIRAGRLEEARPIAEENLETAEAAFPQGRCEVTNLRSVLGRCLYLSGSVDEAERMLDTCLAEYRRMELSAAHFVTLRAVQAVADMWEAEDRPEKAAEYRALLE